MQIDHFLTPAEELVCGTLQSSSLFSILFTAHIKSSGEFISPGTAQSYQLREVYRFISVHHIGFVPTYALYPCKAVTDKLNARVGGKPTQTYFALVWAGKNLAME